MKTEKEIIKERLYQEGKDSANNSEESGNEETDKKKDNEEKDKVAEGLIRYSYLGDEECPLDESMTVSIDSY
jgi:hypothetical protein